MNVLVAYASRHGSTKGSAERIAADLREVGLSAEVMPEDQVRELDRYDAFVIGSAAYMFHWLKEATTSAGSSCPQG
jgi:menaquinone-dependent protoporphyrinogen oxidase